MNHREIAQALRAVSQSVYKLASSSGAAAPAEYHLLLQLTRQLQECVNLAEVLADERAPRRWLFVVRDIEGKTALVSADSGSKALAEQLARNAAEDEHDMVPDGLSSECLGPCDLDISQVLS